MHFDTVLRGVIPERGEVVDEDVAVALGFGRVPDELVVLGARKKECWFTAALGS